MERVNYIVSGSYELCGRRELKYSHPFPGYQPVLRENTLSVIRCKKRWLCNSIELMVRTAEARPGNQGSLYKDLQFQS